MSILWKFDTCVWFQSLAHADDGYRLERYYKDRSIDDIRQAISDIDPVPGDHFVLPDRVDDNGTCHFVVDSSTQLFMQVADIDDNPGAATESLTTLANALSALHAVSSDGARAGGPNGRVPDHRAPRGAAGSRIPATMRRLMSYLDDPSDDAAGFLLEELGTDRRRFGRDLAASVTTVAGPATVVHGNLSLGNIFTGADGRLQIPTGPDSGFHRPEFDLAWIIGELSEIEHDLLRRGRPTERVSAAAESFLQIYRDTSGTDIDMTAVLAIATLRTLLHYLDFATTYPSLEPDAENTRFASWLLDRAREQAA